jgi:hypothetical protein
LTVLQCTGGPARREQNTSTRDILSEGTRVTSIFFPLFIESKSLNTSNVLFFSDEVDNLRWNILVILALITVLALPSAMAQSLVITEPVNNQINPNQHATFKLTITNNELVRQRYSIFSVQSSLGWNVDPHPLKDKIIELAAGQSYTTEIRAQPLEAFVPGIYPIYVDIESDHGEKYRKELKIYLTPEQPLDYLPSILATVDMDERIDVTKPVSIKLFLENTNPLDLQGLVIRLESDIEGFSHEVTVDLPPLTEKTVEFTVTPSPYQQPKEYSLFFVFERDGEVVKVLQQTVEVTQQLPVFEYMSSESSSFLKRDISLNVVNLGNVRNTQDVTFPISLWQIPFIRGAGEFATEDTGRVATWKMTLSPNEEQAIMFSVNYRPGLYALTIIILFSIFYYSVQSPLAVRKKAITTKSDEDGALSEIKITLDVKNKKSASIKNVEIHDTVPAIANVKKGLELGTLKPTNVTHSLRGTKVTWTLAELDGHEHRLITYKVRAKLNIVGTFSLPRAIVHYGKKRGKTGKAYSNQFKLNS